jgi:hypothetical protein
MCKMDNGTQPNKTSPGPAEADTRAARVFEMFGSDLPDLFFEGVFDRVRQQDIPREVTF